MCKLGNNIKIARKRKLLTSKEAASLIGVSSSTWSLYESNKRIPSFHTMIVISRKLEVSLDELAKGVWKYEWEQQTLFFN